MSEADAPTGTWSQEWTADDDSPGWTFHPESGDVSEEDERFIEVSGHGPYRWAVGEPWEGGSVLFHGIADTVDAAKRAAERAWSAAVSSHRDVGVTLDMPSTLAEFLREAELYDDGLEAYSSAQTVRRGRGYSLRVTATLETHKYLLDRCWVLAGGEGIESSPEDRRAYRIYAKRIEDASKAN